ncbi:hypothetical protein DFH29DRAFT_1030334 [Suillus ampliporus]|nr:hypothetical protein DFH29DRAFT_1030334 [Suillus ampliporus]
MRKSLGRDHEEGPRRGHEEGPRRDHKEGPRRGHKEGPRRGHKEGPRRDHKEGPERDHHEGPGRAQEEGPGRNHEERPGRDHHEGPERCHHGGQESAQFDVHWAPYLARQNDVHLKYSARTLIILESDGIQIGLDGNAQMSEVSAWIDELDWVGLSAWIVQIKLNC